ncbi:DNA polymerase I [Vaginisenegalia massiliensis]|uniref:DNA polymerase I n=1 Tax=Vaginisenegalia massiliensis TaxID=2058294 RepID=UPI000F53A165|nr:DNA polymerase I [Vaginisenegalia massiliensis]
MANRRIVLIDGSSLAFRAFFSILDIERFKNKAGLHTNALYSFNRMLDSVLTQFDPTHILVAFDKSNVTFRTEKYAEYKGGRAKTPSEFKEQMPYFRVLLDAYGIRHYDLLNYEADDIIGTLSQMADDDDQVIVVSGDKDLIQLARPHVTVYVTKRGVSDLEAYTPETIMEKYGLTTEQFIDLKGLMGDPSDNYPGVTRIGEKTAIKLLTQFGSLANMYENLDQLKASKMKENIINDREQAFMSQDLARIKLDTPIELSLDDISYQGKNPEQLLAFYRQMEFNSFIKDLLGDLPVEELTTAQQDEEAKFDQVFVDQTLDPAYLPNHGAYYCEMLEENYHMGQVVAVTWVDLATKCVYYSLDDHVLHDPLFVSWLEDASKTKVCLDFKREQVIASRYGIQMAGCEFDVQLAAYLLDTNLSQELIDIAQFLQLPSSVQYDELVYGKGAKRAVPDDQTSFSQHIVNKALTLSQVQTPLETKLRELEMWDLYQTIEMPLARVLARMEIQGVKVDAATLEIMNEDLLAQLAVMEKNIHRYAGVEFNLNSPKQLGEILFENLGLPVIKKTKTGYSTAADVLEKLSGQHPIIDELLNYRQLAKLQGTYLAGLPRYILEDGKIHTRFVQTLTQTGRLSSTDPNLQNIPIRLEEGRKIRKAFIPSKEGWILFGSDYSQIELRVLAHICEDPHMRQAFIDDEDIHSATARRVFGLDPDAEITSLHRRQAKAVNFGIVYGISDYGLSQNLNITRKAAKEFIDRYFAKYPGVAQYMEDIVEQAREKGYVSTLFNRRRFLPEIHASNFNVRSFAERTAMNSPIQGTAADILKIAMVRLQDEIDQRGLQAKLLLQVHDELIIEAPAEELDILNEMVPRVMESAVELSIPLKVEFNHGDNWYELK